MIASVVWIAIALSSATPSGFVLASDFSSCFDCGFAFCCDFGFSSGFGFVSCYDFDCFVSYLHFGFGCASCCGFFVSYFCCGFSSCFDFGFASYSGCGCAWRWQIVAILIASAIRHGF